MRYNFSSYLLAQFPCPNRSGSFESSSSSGNINVKLKSANQIYHRNHESDPQSLVMQAQHGMMMMIMPTSNNLTKTEEAKKDKERKKRAKEEVFIAIIRAS